jgi:hypothetical protein
MIAAETEVAIAGAVAVGGGVAAALAADDRRAARAAGAICLLRNMHHLRATNPVDMTIAVVNPAATTIAVRMLRVPRRLPLPKPPKRKSFSQANPLQSIAASRL